MKSLLEILKLSFLLVLLASLGFSASAFYDPALGRWINRDPIQEQGGNNQYEFVENSPIVEHDVDGLILGRRNRSSCSFWDNLITSPNACTAAYAAAAAVACRTFGESPWEQCQRWCLQATFTTAGQNCTTPQSIAIFVAATSARYACCAAACAIDTGIKLPTPPVPFPIPRL